MTFNETSKRKTTAKLDQDSTPYGGDCRNSSEGRGQGLDDGGVIERMTQP